MFSFSITTHDCSPFLKYMFKFVLSMKGNKHMPAVITDVHYFTFYCLLFNKYGGVCVYMKGQEIDRLRWHWE